jgi:N-acetylmuramoyl-L-alanine amidase
MRSRAIWIVGLAAVAAAIGPPLRSQTLVVSAVRFWTFSETTRVAVELSGEFEYRSERLHNPERVFFDIPRARPAMGPKQAVIGVDDKLLKRVRVAETQPAVTRVVLDLAGTAEFTASQLSNPDRLMIELRPAAAPPIPIVSESPQPPPALPAPVVQAREPALRPLDKPIRADAAPAGLPEPPATVIEPRRPPPVPAPPVEAPLAARRATDGHSSLTRALGLKVTRVVIDPGHGGHDQGTVGTKGLLEKDLVLDVAQRLGQLIEERMGSEVIYTRSDDTFIPLEGRTQLANEKKADLFISIHANSSPYPSIRGVETFYLNFTSARDALDVAARENAGSQKSVFELRDLIQQISLHEKLEESKDFAGRMQTSMQTFERTYSPTAKNRGVKKAPFVVLIHANMPSILCEIGFLSNAREEALLKRPEHRQKLADALYRGVNRYAQSLSHFQVAEAGRE